jgi:hypothetical protein
LSANRTAVAESGAGSPASCPLTPGSALPIQGMIAHSAALSRWKPIREYLDQATKGLAGPPFHEVRG